MKTLFILLCVFISFHCQSNEIGKNIDMAHPQRISFDSIVETISCVKLEKLLFEACKSMIPYKDHFYFMGSIMAGSNLVMYDKEGKFVKEINFSDALLVNSMCMVPERDELWVTSQFKVLSKYKTDGSLIKRFLLPFNCANIYPVDKQNFLIYSGGGPNHIEKHYFALTDFQAIHNLFRPMQNNNKNGHNHWSLFAPTAKNKQLFLFLDGVDTIFSYNIQKQTLKPYYKLDFHGDFLLESQEPTDDREMAEIITKRKYIYGHYSFYQASDKLFFKLVGKREDFCMIDLKADSLYAFDRLFDSFQSRYVNPFVSSDGTNLYLLVREKDLLEHYMNVKCTYPAIRDLLPTLNSERNGWILVTIQIKSSES